MRKKTSVYLDEEQVIQLRRLAEREGRSQAEVLREAVAHYASGLGERPDRGSNALWVDGSGASIGEVPNNELMKGYLDWLRAKQDAEMEAYYLSLSEEERAEDAEWTAIAAEGARHVWQ